MKKLIFGYGATGKAVETYFKNNNVEYLIFDDNKELNFPVDLSFNNNKLIEIDEVVISPGVKPSHPFLEKFISMDIPIITDIDIFNNYYSNKIIGVTGTNGKTTFVNLLNDFINSQGLSSIALGNVGQSPLDIIGRKFDYLILELSSFQLYYLQELKLSLAIILNIHQDHLDWHDNYKNYKDSKLKIKKFVENESNRFLIDSNSNIEINKKYDLNKLPFFRNLSDIFMKTIIHLDLDIDLAYKFLINSKNQEHRYEYIEKINDVIYINDSKSTNFHSVSSASTKVKNGILIMHGLTKNISSEELKISSSIKTILIPKDMNVNLDKFTGNKVYIDSIFEIEEELKKIIKPGDTVLFSCGGASFNDFNNYQERGNYFKKVVNKLKDNDE